MNKKKKPETKLVATEEEITSESNSSEKPSPKRVEPIRRTIALNPQDLQSTLDLMYKHGRMLGFQEGIKYIVTLAENFLVEHEKLPSRDSLSQFPYSQKLPTWWIATLIKALDYQPHGDEDHA